MRTPSEPEDLITGINVTPLVDIVLVLLIVLMTALAYVSSRAIPMDLPSLGEAEVENEVATLTVTIDADGALFADGEPVTPAELRGRASRIAPRPEARAIIAADPRASHDAFIRALDVLRAAGIRRYGVHVDHAE